ncbi:MAG: hypothetical protein NTV87_13190, partial [Ignavibacteriae bacterium]|nr:hypothetical protein [Ignavibacteriota bacterium]
MRKRNIFYVLSIVLLAVMVLGFYQLKEDPNADKAPVVNDQSVNNLQSDTIAPAGFPYPTLFNFNYSGIAGMNGGTVGAMFLGGKYYFNAWNGTSCYRYNNSGPGGGPGTQVDVLTYAGAIRDLSTDGVFIYGGNSTTGILRFDPNTMATLKTFTLTGGSTRAIAWDPNRHGFWNTGFAGGIFLHDTNGVLIRTIASTLAGKYGLGFDSTSSSDSSFLWVWDQTSTTQNGIHKIHIASGTTKATYIFNNTGASIGTAGGAEVIANAIPGKLTLLLNYQNFALVGYNLKNLSAPARVWSEQTSGLATTLYSISAVSNDVAWTCGASGKVLRTTNKGTTWTNVSGNLPATALLYCIFAWDANTAIATASPSGSVMIYKTSNGGVNWVTAFSLTATGAFGDDLWMTSATDAYYIGDPQGGNWHLLKSTNGGDNWASWSTLATTNTAGTYNNAAWFQGTQVWFPSVGQSH